MKSLQLSIMVFCHVLLASLVFYFAASLAAASPIVAPAEPAPASRQEARPSLEARPPVQRAPEALAQAAPAQVVEAAPAASAQAPAAAQAAPAIVAPAIPLAAPAPPAAAAKSSPASVLEPLTERKAAERKAAEPKAAAELKAAAEPKALEPKAAAREKSHEQQQRQPVVAKLDQPAAVPQPQALVAAPASVAQVAVQAGAQQHQPAEPVGAALQALADGAAPASTASKRPQVNGGLGPLHLLASTLCSYQPDRLVVDDAVNQLQARRAIVRKSLFDFMSLKFTNLEKLSSRLGTGLQVVPVKSVADALGSSSGAAGAGKPSHGWPVVGKCTAHDLKLMGEAAWCECQDGVQDCGKQQQQQQDKKPSPEPADKEQAAKQQQVAAKTARAIETVDSFSPEQSSVISKILHVSDAKEAPVIENNFYNLNLTQNQLAALEAQATSTQQCRRNALRYSKALFQHLAEDQQSASGSWQQLYALISADDCARKRMIDIVNALSSFRTDTTSIRRDNVEFAFAMDDLRTKVLENEVNVPLTFDRHFIEVEQFLQQSVRLMLTSVQPKKAKLTTMRYRSLMYGADFDDKQQCIDLHQRLLANNYPNDCNPMQFGQLPDVLRMTANSLELWSIEKELGLHLAKIADYPNVTPVGQQKVKENVNECIANLVTS